MNQRAKNTPPVTAQPIAAATSASRSWSSSAATIITAYAGATMRVGSSVVRQSTTASTTPTAASGSRNNIDQDQPTLAARTAPTSAHATAHFQASPGRAAISA